MTELQNLAHLKVFCAISYTEEVITLRPVCKSMFFMQKVSDKAQLRYVFQVSGQLIRHFEALIVKDQ